MPEVLTNKTVISLDTDAEFVEKMAGRSVLYQNSFREHTRAIRGTDKKMIADAYAEVSKNGDMFPCGTARQKLSDDELTAVEQRLHTPAHTVYEHVLTSLIAHNLLLSHIDVVARLPSVTASRINARINELRSKSKPSSGEGQSSSTFRPLIPPAPLPMLMRPDAPTLSPLNEHDVQQMLASPSSLVGKMFLLEQDDIYYRIAAIEFSMHATTIFRLQYEGLSCVADDLSEDEMKNMLTDSAVVSLQA